MHVLGDLVDVCCNLVRHLRHVVHRRDSGRSGLLHGISVRGVGGLDLLGRRARLWVVLVADHIGRTGNQVTPDAPAPLRVAVVASQDRVAAAE